MQRPYQQAIIDKKKTFMKRKNAYYDYECYLKDML